MPPRGCSTSSWRASTRPRRAPLSRLPVGGLTAALGTAPLGLAVDALGLRPAAGTLLARAELLRLRLPLGLGRRGLAHGRDIGHRLAVDARRRRLTATGDRGRRGRAAADVEV